MKKMLLQMTSGFLQLESTLLQNINGQSFNSEFSTGSSDSGNIPILFPLFILTKGDYNFHLELALNEFLFFLLL
jgi:hypothetical protein